MRDFVTAVPGGQANEPFAAAARVTLRLPVRAGSLRGSAPTAGVVGTLAVGGDIVRDIAPQALWAGALFLLGGGAGVAVLIVTAVRRGNARR